MNKSSSLFLLLVRLLLRNIAFLFGTHGLKWLFLLVYTSSNCNALLYFNDTTHAQRSDGGQRGSRVFAESCVGLFSVLVHVGAARLYVQDPKKVISAIAF